MSIVSRILQGEGNEKSVTILITVSGADVTNSVVYDNSTLINDTSKGCLMGYMISGSDSLVNLTWDQTTDSPILAANPVNSPKGNMSKFGGIHNPNGAGATGDILLTTLGVASGEIVTIILWIYQI